MKILKISPVTAGFLLATATAIIWSGIIIARDQDKKLTNIAGD
jgi:hypothetical protein